MNLDFVEHMVQLVGDYPVSEISVEQAGQRVCVKRPLVAVAGASPLAAAPAPGGANGAALTAEPAAESADRTPAEIAPEEARTLTATMVGVFHHADPPIPYAAEIMPGQVVGSIESMKLMNEVLAETGGRVTDVLIEDGAPVEYGQALFRLAA